jgi:Mg2+ and Co2+ transporter CorA
MKCLNEFTRWKLSMSVHSPVHPSEIWSASWDACENYYAPYVNQLELRIAELEQKNEKLQQHNGDLILDLHLKDAIK